MSEAVSAGAMRAADTILARFGKVHPRWQEWAAQEINREFPWL
jgi:hypothetical protein